MLRTSPCRCIHSAVVEAQPKPSASNGFECITLTRCKQVACSKWISQSSRTFNLASCSCPSSAHPSSSLLYLLFSHSCSRNLPFRHRRLPRLHTALACGVMQLVEVRENITGDVLVHVLHLSVILPVLASRANRSVAHSQQRSLGAGMACTTVCCQHLFCAAGGAMGGASGHSAEIDAIASSPMSLRAACRCF